MISFNSENLIINFRSSDDIGIDQFITPDRLDYIFENYLFYKLEENINSTYIKYIYAIKEDKLEMMLSDNNLSNIEKVLLSYYIILSSVDGVEISLITSIKNPNHINIIWSTKISKNTLAMFVSNTVGVSKQNGYLSTIKSINVNEINIEPVDDFLLTLTTINHNSLTDYYIAPTALQYGSTMLLPDLVLVKEPEISDTNYTNIVNGEDFKSFFPPVYDYATLLTERTKSSGFVFEVNFNGLIQYLLIGGTSENYRLKTRLFDMLNYISSLSPDQNFSFNQYSYISTNAEKIAYIQKAYNGSYYNYIYWYPNPFCRWDLKFTFQVLDPLEMPVWATNYIATIYTSLPGLGKGNQYNLYYYKTSIKYEFNTIDDILTEYLSNTYNSDSTVFTIETNFINFKNNYLTNIKKYVNDKTKQLEYWDVRGEFVNTSIGNIDDIEYIDIQGFDTSSSLPILLYVSKNINIGGFLSRLYKISKGGIVPINNDSLHIKYSSSNFTYIFQFNASSSTGYTGNLYDYNALHNWVYGLNLNFNSRYYLSKTFDTTNTLYYNYSKLTTPTTKSFYLYKMDSDKLMISTDGETLKLLPYKVLMELMPLTTEQEVFTKLDTLFYKTTDVVNTTDCLYNTIYFSYLNIISHKYYYLITNNNATGINRNLNSMLVDSLYKQIKQSALTKLYKDPILTDYTFVQMGDLCSIDDVYYGTYDDLKNMITDNITPITYDTDDTNVCTIDSIISILIGSDLYKVDMGNTENTYILTFLDFNKILNSSDKIFIFNKVIGIDLYAYFSLLSDENDNTFSDYFMNTLYDFNGLIILLDLDNGKLKSVSTNILEFNSSDKNPVTISQEYLADPLLYKVSKNSLDSIIAKYKQYNHIYDLGDIDIVYSYAPINNTDKLTLNPNREDMAIIR